MGPAWAGAYPAVQLRGQSSRTGALPNGRSGALALAAAMAVRQDWAAVSDLGFLASAASFGAIGGGVIAPVTGSAVLRGVPLGWAMLRTTIAAVLGGAMTGARVLENIALPVCGTLLGFLIEVACLQVNPPQRRAVPPALVRGRSSWSPLDRRPLTNAAAGSSMRR